MASDLQSKTIFGDEEILQSATSQLLTFTNIAGTQFDRTQKAALDLATRLDGDLKSASIQLGKALNDPVKNLSALSRSGIQFSEDQKSVITSLTETGRLAEAQTIILDELEKQYGGSAEAAAKAGTGGIKQLQNAFGDLQEEFGKIIMDFLPPLINGLKSLIQGFSGLSDSTKKTIVVISGIAAAIGPILLVIPALIKGFSVFAAGLKIARTAMLAMNAVMLANPAVLITAGIVALGAAVYAFSRNAKTATDAQGQMNAGMADAQKMAAKESVEVEKLARRVEDQNLSQRQRIEALEELKRIAPDHFGNLDMEKVKMGELATAVDSYRDSLVKAAEVRVFQQMLDEAIESQAQFRMEVKQMAKDLNITEEEALAMSGAVGAAFSDGADSIKENENLIEELTKKLQELSSDGFETAKSAGGTVVSTLDNLSTQAEETTQELDDLTYALQQINTLGDMALDPSLKKRAQEQRMRGGVLEIEEIEMPDESDMGFSDKELEMMTEKVDNFYSNLQQQTQNAIQLSETAGGMFGNMFGEIIQGEASAGEAMKKFGKQALRTMLGIARAHAVAVFSSPTNPANLASGGLATPAVIAGGLALVEGLLGAIPFADGGIVSGPTLGLVGEYSGAKTNPEVIAPLDKLRDMIEPSGGGGHVTVTGKISGNDLVLVQEKGSDALRRSRGQRR
jgi:hypothetical protein